MFEQEIAIPDATSHPHYGARGIGIILAAILAIFVDQTAASIAGTSLPYLQAITATSPDSASWIISAFNATYYACILLSPWLIARFGLRHTLLTALLGCATVSALLTFVTNFPLFIVLRAVQGAFQGCIFVPAVLRLFTALPTAALKFAPPAFVLVSLTGATLGTAIGGYVADTYSAQFAFLPTAGATFCTALIIFAAARNHDKPQPNLRFDYGGVALSILCFALLQFISNEGERRNWLDDAGIRLAIAGVFVAVPAFFYYEALVTRTPHVDVRMFAKYRNLSVGALTNVVVGAVGYSVTLLINYLETTLGATPTVAGEIVIARAFTYAVGVPVAFYFLIIRASLDTRAIIRIGAVGSVVCLCIFAHTMTTMAAIGNFVALSFAFGFFFGFMNQPLGALVIGSMPLPLLAAGIAIYKLSSPLGSMAATGAMQTIVDHTGVAIQTQLAGSLVSARPVVNIYAHLHRGENGGLLRLALAEARADAEAYATQLLALLLVIVIPLVQLAIVKKAERKVTNV